MTNILKNILKRLSGGTRANPAERQVESVKPADGVAPKGAFAETDCHPVHKQESPRNRHGILLLKPTDDLTDFFQDPETPVVSPDDEPEDKAADKSADLSADKSADKAADKSGDKSENESGEGPQDKPDDKPDGLIDEANFSRMVEETLSDADYQEMIREKKTGLPGLQDDRKRPFPRRPRFRPPPRAQIDLHGFTAEQGRLRAEAFIRASRARGVDAVRIIVGRGIHSQGGAVLPEMVEELAIILEKQGVVDSFAWEGGKKIRSGALIIYPSRE